MSRILTCLGVLGSLMAGAASAHSQTLIAASDASQIAELNVAQVMAPGSARWLGLRLRGKTRVAVVTSDSAVESAPGADAWLRALDFTTRVRVAAPPGPLSSCGSNQDFAPVDTGLPEPPTVAIERVEAVSSELELRRALEDAGLQVDAERSARFASQVSAPFRISLYDAAQGGGRIAALRVHGAENPSAAPQIVIMGRDTVPLSLIALAPAAATLPAEGRGADPSEFPVTYRAANATTAVLASSDYLAARGAWLLDHSQRWLVETQNSSSLFAWTVLAPKSLLAPVVTPYFQGLDGSCAAQAQAAYARGSRQATDYACGDHDDLALSLSQLGFGDPRLSRLYGLLGADGVTFRLAEAAQRSPLSSATDFDTSACPPSSVGIPIGGMGTSPTDPPRPVVVSDPGPSGYPNSDPGTPVYTNDGSCNVTIVDSESCTGDSSSSEPSSNDSCSGDSSGDSSSSDSCSGDSSGDSSDGCSKSDGYDGDTCTGSSHSSAEATRSSSAALRADGSRRNRPRRVHLSLLTLLAAALALPFRRLRALRF